MIRHLTVGASVIAVVLLSGVNANSANPTELKTEQGKSIGFANFVAARSDCSTAPGPQPLPILVEKPSNGKIGMQIATTDIAAAGNCSVARKVPSIALFYVPNPDFVGVDSIQLEMDAGDNKVATLAYRITVQAAAVAKH